MDTKSPSGSLTDILDWWAENERGFPCHQTTDGFKFLISEMLLQRSRSRSVANVYPGLFERWPGEKISSRSSCNASLRCIVWRLIYRGLGSSNQRGGGKERSYNCHERPLICPGDVKPHAHQYRCHCVHQQGGRIPSPSDRADVPSPEVSCPGEFGQWDGAAESDAIEKEAHHE